MIPQRLFIYMRLIAPSIAATKPAMTTIAKPTAPTFLPLLVSDPPVEFLSAPCPQPRPQPPRNQQGFAALVDSAMAIPMRGWPRG
ncbi:hypothetical protein QBC44DRAFT_333093 [Cladorrhinum sp. PSN332]|nr:hypothetical protein QBC44DRAFT_333093 [Cladorrhinum sp. PSN332]